MFVRPCWVPGSDADTRSLIAENPWALLVSNGDDGPLATNLPPLPERGSGEADEPLVLVGHLARANHHLRQLQTSPAAVLAIFEGPWSYVTASWYPGRQMPSTYYYTAVHCYGRLHFQSVDELDSSLATLTEQMEAPHANGWRIDEIPRSEITRRLPAIAGFRMVVSRIEAKFKLGEDEPLGDALAVAEALDAREAPQASALAQMICDQNAGRAAGTPPAAVTPPNPTQPTKEEP